MRNSGFSVAPLVDILLGMELDSNKGIFPGFNTGDILQALPVVVPRQSFPKPSHPKPATIDSTSLSEMTPRYLVKLVGVRQCSWKLMVIFSSLISRITSGGAWTSDIYIIQGGRGHQKRGIFCCRPKNVNHKSQQLY